MLFAILDRLAVFCRLSAVHHRPHFALPQSVAAACFVAGWAVSLPAQTAHPATAQPTIETAVAAAFVATADGFSSDEVLLHDERYDALVAAVRQRLPETDAKTAALTLLRLRKAGKLPAQTTRRAAASDPAIQPVAEIAARQVMNQYQVTTDQILADPRLRKELQQAAEAVQPRVDSYAIRKAMVGLRKKRSLKPELVLRVADWKREVAVHAITELVADPTLVPSSPGVYLFRDATGYVYIGEAKNLRARLAEHLSGSDRLALAAYLRRQTEQPLTVETHAFPVDSPASRVTVRRAYESELIRSREPRLNVRP